MNLGSDVIQLFCGTLYRCKKVDLPPKKKLFLSESVSDEEEKSFIFRLSLQLPNILYLQGIITPTILHTAD